MVELVVFFVKQRTAYEVRISDWSSDVCSSDLVRRCFVGKAAVAHGRNVGLHRTGDGTAFGKEILDELRPPVAAVQAEDVVQHQHLAVAVRAGADADGG